MRTINNKKFNYRGHKINKYSTGGGKKHILHISQYNKKKRISKAIFKAEGDKIIPFDPIISENITLLETLMKKV